MGRTVPTYRQRLHEELERWRCFRSALLRDEREDFDRLLDQAFRYVHAGSMCPEREPFEVLVISLLLAHESRLRSIERVLSVEVSESGARGLDG
ncbi:MAG: hypothetical protein NZ733_00305 [Aigarchaeota archaeon]|nr:hypothetical protein [Aigarchaeota archaeon]